MIELFSGDRGDHFPLMITTNPLSHKYSEVRGPLRSPANKFYSEEADLEADNNRTSKDRQHVKKAPEHLTEGRQPLCGGALMVPQH